MHQYPFHPCSEKISLRHLSEITCTIECPVNTIIPFLSSLINAAAGLASSLVVQTHLQESPLHLHITCTVELHYAVQSTLTKLTST